MVLFAYLTRAFFGGHPHGFDAMASPILAKHLGPADDRVKTARRLP
jgi:hypothetical protein